MVEVVAAADECTAVLERRVPAAHTRGTLGFASRRRPTGRARPGLRGEGRPGAAVLGGGCWAGAGRVLGGGRTAARPPWLA
eukprot:scaffold62472_cov69-Phaeocystis_antarctica.AAC.3